MWLASGDKQLEEVLTGIDADDGALAVEARHLRVERAEEDGKASDPKGSQQRVEDDVEDGDLR